MQKLKNLKSNWDLTVDGVMMKYDLSCFGENGKSIFSFFREKLSKRSSDLKWTKSVHEYLDVNGKIQTVDILLHINKKFKLQRVEICLF